MKSRRAPWFAVLAILAFFSLLHLPAPPSSAVPPAPAQQLAPPAWATTSYTSARDLPLPGSWSQGIPIDPRAEASAAFNTTSAEAVSSWQYFYGSQYGASPANPPAEGSYRQAWDPRGWLVLTSAAAQELPAPPAQGQTSTLADSMYARWVIQHHIAQQLDKLLAEGITVQATADPAQTALLTQIEAHLKTLVDKPTPTGGSGITPEQLKALTDAISGIGTAVEALGDELEGILGSGVTPPADPAPQP